MKIENKKETNVDKRKSKYFNTALMMDMAFLELLERKDFEYITIREICDTAGVNRSTFYLHYDNTSDLLEECYEYALKKLYDCYDHVGDEKYYSCCAKEELYLTHPKYLMPFLNYVKENQRLFKTIAENKKLFNINSKFEKMFSSIFIPILKRLNVPKSKQRYLILFYLNGIYAIVNEWMRNGFKEAPEEIIETINICTNFGFNK